MDEVKIRYGNSTLSLTKSNTLVGLRRSPPADHQGMTAFGAVQQATKSADRQLGGFELFSIDDASLPMETTLDHLRSSPEVEVGTHVYYTSDDSVPFVPTGKLHLEFTPETSLGECERILSQHGLEVLQALSDHELIVRITPGAANPVTTASKLQELPEVRIAEPDLATPGKLLAFSLPNDSMLAEQWHLKNTGEIFGISISLRPGADARVVEAWERASTLGEPGVVVAIIDDGFDLLHPDLGGNWKIVAPRDFTRLNDHPSPDPSTKDWHGTACAGVAVGNANNGGILGAAPGCRLMPVRWAQQFTPFTIGQWFDYVREQGAAVVSCSWKARAAVYRLSTYLERAIERCAREGRGGLGCVVCFAAGNESNDIDAADGSSVNGFANHPDVIAVSACTSRDERSNYSNFGAAISLSAPSDGAGGRAITTSDVTGRYSWQGMTYDAGYDPGDYTRSFGGTSSACPLVAGICALVLSIRPDLKALEVKDLLQRTARRIGDPASYNPPGHSPYFGYGCVDAAEAVGALLGANEADPMWGKKGHEGVNNRAIEALPDELRDLIEPFAAEIESHAMDADHEKDNDKGRPEDQKERPRHFLDIDAYGDYPFTELPEDYDAAVKKFGKDTVLDRGTLPWALEARYQELVKAFIAKDINAAVTHAAWLGHYVGDAHVPFHATKNHDGQLTGQKGMHRYFETRLLKLIQMTDILPAPAAPVPLPARAAAFQWVRESYTYVRPLLDADRKAGGRTDAAFEKFVELARPIAIQRLTSAANRLASLWWTAWLEAGRPAIGPPVLSLASTAATSTAGRKSRKRE